MPVVGYVGGDFRSDSSGNLGVPDVAVSGLRIGSLEQDTVPVGRDPGLTRTARGTHIANFFAVAAETRSAVPRRRQPDETITTRTVAGHSEASVDTCRNVVHTLGDDSGFANELLAVDVEGPCNQRPFTVIEKSSRSIRPRWHIAYPRLRGMRRCLSGESSDAI